MDFMSGTGEYVKFLPLVVFLARIADVSLGTLRINFVARGFKFRASLIGFIEVLIWITIVAQIVREVHSWANILAFAGGFATGTYVGMRIEEHLAIGNVWVRVISPLNPGPLVTALRADGYGVTLLDAQGANGPTTILLILARRSHLDGVLGQIQAFLPDAFYTVEDVRDTRQGIFPGRSTPGPDSE